MSKIIALSGSSIKSGVVEKAMEHVLKSSGHNYELIRLGELDMKHCIGCGGCVNTNRCIIKDDLNDVFEKLEKADAMLIGAPAKSGSLNSLTGQFFERLSALYHNDMLEGKPVISIAGGLFNQNDVLEKLSSNYKGFKLKEIGSLKVGGNAACYKCGRGENCEKSVFRTIYGENKKITKDVFYVFENDKEALAKASELGKIIEQSI